MPSKCCCMPRALYCKSRVYCPPRRSRDLRQTCSIACIILGSLATAVLATMVAFLFGNANLPSSFLPPSSSMRRSRHSQVAFDIVVVSVMTMITIGCIASSIYFTWSCLYCYHYPGDNLSDDERDYQNGMWYRDDDSEVPLFNDCC